MRLRAIVFGISFLIACEPKQNGNAISETVILNDAFMDMVDTVAYSYHNLRPAPGDSTYTDTNTLNIAVAPELPAIGKWAYGITASAREAGEEDSARIMRLLNKAKSDTAEHMLALDNLTKTGRYRLFAHESHSMKIDTLSAIGKLEFTRTYSEDNYAITVVTIRDAIKNGIVKLFLLEKREGLWRKKNEYILEIW